MARGDREGPRERFRIRVIAFVLVPVLVLGVCYFLLVEYIAIRPDVVLGTSLVGLRLGGAAVILLALILAVGTGYLLADRVARPIRLLLRFAESGELPAGAGLFVHHRDWEVFLLYRRIHALIQQNRAGAAALDELESLRSSFDTLREALGRTGQNGVLAPIGTIEGPCADVAALLESHRARLLDFFRELKTRTEEVRVQLDALESARSEGALAEPGDALVSTNGTGGGVSAPELPTGELRDMVRELRRFGTVLSLEVERMRPDPENAGRLYREFESVIDRLEAFAERDFRESADAGSADGSAIPESGELTGSDSENQTPSGRDSAGPDLADPVSSGQSPSESTESEHGASGNGEANMTDVWHRLREDLGSLERRLEEVEER